IASCGNKNYHIHIKIINKSDKDLLFCIKYPKDGKCLLEGEIVEINKEIKYRPFNQYIERSLKGDSRINLYLVDPDKYNDPNTYYDCDSLFIKNKVLKHYSLTIRDLEEKDFTLIYRSEKQE
ncbi:MAG: hypothetical protein ACEPOV_07605, partial [Hyphomicrobiales bacterium]